MVKKIVQDVLPPENKSIRNIPISRRQSSITRSVPSTPRQSIPQNTFETRQLDSRRTEKARVPVETQTNDFIAPPRMPSRSGLFSHKRMWLSAFVAVIFLAFATSFLFVSADIEVQPKTEVANLSTSLLAKKSPQAGELGFDVITISRELGKNVEASGEEKVEKKASGKIVIFNKNSKTSQKLVANTRFENTKGQIYRISEAVTVPGYTTNGNEIVAGSIVVTVYADAPGEAYNSGLTDFTIPGFKGDPRFSTIFARSEGPMQGGFSGMMKKITTETLEKTETDLEKQLQDQLLIEAKSQIPDDYILFPGAVSFSFESSAQTDVTDKSVKVNRKGTIVGMILNTKTLNSQLAKNTLTPAGSGEVYVSNIEDLTLVLPDDTKITSTSEKDVSFTLKGQAKFIWTFDQEKLKHDLAGKSKKNLGSVLVSYPAIEKAKATLRPFWKFSFPKNTNKITVKINTEE